MHAKPLTHASLALMLGAAVTGPDGVLRGRLKDVAVATGPSAGNVSGLVLRTAEGLRIVAVGDVAPTSAGALVLRPGAVLRPLDGEESFLLLRQDLIDRQIIDVHGRKVVRVNDVDLSWNRETQRLRVLEVEVGLGGALRRLLKGVVPRGSLEGLSRRFTPKVIPWEFVDVIEVDPARQVRLKIEHERLAQMHPSDIADILEELAPAEREAVFGSLDEEVAADALEEVEPRLQKSLLDALDSGRVADIVEEMDPGAAADLLAELPEDRSEAILGEMEPAERQEVEELLEFHEDSAAGRMTTDFVHTDAGGSVADAVRALSQFEGDVENVTEVYLTGGQESLVGVVPVTRLLLSPADARLSALAAPRAVSCSVDANRKEVAELFDKYNLRQLPVVDDEGHLSGVILADQVIAFLREQQ